MRVSIGSLPPHCAAPSTKAGRQWTYDGGWSGIPPPASPSLSLTSLTMWPGGTTVSGSALPAAMFACLTRHRLRRSLPTLRRRPLGLRAVAPGVLVASVDEHELLPLLQELGHAPAIENGAGEVIGTQPARRATGHVAKQQDIPSAAEVADTLLARERRQQVYAESAAGRQTQAVGRSSVPRTLARSIE